MQSIPAFLIFWFSIALLSVAQAKAQPKTDLETIKAHINFLAHDQLKGRETGTRGHEIASLYIASQFRQYGLLPKGNNDTYFQRVPFRKSLLDQQSPALTLNINGDDHKLTYPKQFLMSASTTHLSGNLSGEIVFVGYGIVADELEHNDYTGLDVKGKVVALLSGKPKSFPSEEGAHFASGRQKAKYAASRGAIGMITISTPTAEKIRPWAKLLTRLHTPSLRWLKEDGDVAGGFPSIQQTAYLSKEAAEVLFRGAKQSLAQIYQQLENDESPAGFVLNASVTMSSKSEFSKISSPNVVGFLEGSDPVLKNEYVIFTAHSDHVGMARTVKKDKINNGAMDNAMGTAMLLETARLFSQIPPPKRSLLFVAVTAEEKGLLGSDYYASNPTVPISQIVANINLDMPLLLWDFKDVIAWGASHSDLKGTVSDAATRLGLTLSPDPWPEQAIFTRSDHYSFVKKGIPAVFIFPGLATADNPKAGAKFFGEFMANHYHMPSDEIHDGFNDAAMKRFADVNFMIGEVVANQAKKPQWNPKDFFGETFSGVKEKAE